MAKVKINFASLTDAQNAAPVATESASTKSTGFNFSSLADSDVATPEAQPSKKKVDTGLSGTTSSTVGIYKPVKVALPKATEDDDSIWDNLAGFASTVKNSLSPALRTLPVNLVSGATAFVTNLVTGVIKNTISEEDFKKDPYLQTIVDTIEKPSKDLLEAAANVNKAVQPQIDLAKAQAGVKEEYMNMPISETMSKDVGQGFRKLGVAAVSQIPQFVGLALAGGGSKARTFIAGATLGTTQAIQQEYEQDKDISGIDVAQSAMKGVVEGLTEMIFDTDLKAAQNIGKAVVDVTIEGGKKAIKDMIESVGKEATRNVIVRNYKDVVKNGLKGMSEESLEEVIATGASFVVDAIDSGKLNVNDYKKLAFDMLDAGMIGAAIGGPVSVMSAVLSKKNLTEEQRVNVSKFQEVANDKSLSPEIRQIAKDRINKIVDYDSDLVEEQYNKLAALPLNNRLEAFGVLSKINSLEEDSRKIKDLTLQEDNKKIIDGYKADLDKIFEANKPAAEVVEEPKTVTPEEAADLEKARQEELAKANESFKATMGVPGEPMKVSPEFSIKTGNEELGVNNAYEPSPNMPLEVVKKEEVKPVQFTTKSNPDSLLEGEVYTVSQGNKKFGTILSTSRNGVQEYYIPEMDNAKPYSNLDDAKFALEERLRGRFIPEVERSGIDRLRADKGLPKVDLVYKNDNGEDVVLPSESKKSIQNAVKAFKTVSPAPVYLYKNTEDFKKGVALELGEDSKALEEADKVGGGFFTNARNEDSIHINLANLNKTSVAHELFHGTVVNIARQNPSAFAEMRDAIINKLGDNELINVIDENGKRINLSAKEYLDRYSKQYSPSQQAEEFLGELTGLLTTDIAKLKDPTIWETIKLAIRNLVKTAGIDIPIFEKTANINQTVSFFNDLAKSLKTGGEIKLGKLNLKNEKQTTKQGAAVQATNGESKAAKEDESLRDSVSEIVEKKQRRSGNPIKKKDRPPSKEGVRALAIEPVNPSDYAYQYFANNGQVLRGNKDANEKDALFSLFSKGRQGIKKEATKELRDRVNMIDNRENGALSISEIAEKLFAEYQQATKGDVGIDVDTPYDYMDFRNAVEDAILGYKSGKEMAVAMLESKNQATEEDAAALTEEEELNKLRNRAEAQAMGMTEEEFMSKLAELQDTPEIQAIEEAYSQALDMIDDEEFAKLYELNDEDVAKIDELMADLDSTDGALDDKLAEQKKVVRDLEAERKKVVAAMDKASKESQLDITGKAPIQEQLFGADTKSLTDRLQSIDVQLATAKADVAATQSAIDFQERGTVDMFEGKTETEPKKSSVQPLSEKSIDVLKTSRFGGNEQLEAWTEELELLDEKISKLEKAGKGRGFQSLDWFKEQAESYRGRIKRKKIELAEIEAELAAREVKPAKPAVEPIKESELIASVKKASKAKQVRIENFGDSFLMLLTFDEGERQITHIANEARINDTIELLERKVSGLKNRDLVQAQEDLVELAKDSSTPASRLSAKKRQINSIKEQIKDIEQVELPFAKYVSANIQKQPAPVLETAKPTKPAKEDKIEAEIKFLQGEIEAYEREIENSLEEIENTKSNYKEEVAKIKEKKAALAKEKLSRDERDERKEELDAELEDAADERDTYIEQYKDTIADAKSELKKLNKRLAKLQEANPNVKFQKQGVSVAPEYKYQMNEMFKDPQRLTKDIEAKYDIRSTLNERGKIEGALIEVERKLTDQIVTNALSKVGVAAFKTIGAIENAPLFKAGTGKTVKLKEALTGWSGYTANKLRNATLKAIQGNNKYAASAGRVAASLIGNLAKSDVLQQQRALRSGSQLDANNSIAMLSKSLNGMIGFDDRALMRVHSLLDPEAFAILGGEDVVTSPSELSLQELRLYNTLRDMNDFIHEWHFQNEFIDQATYEKHKGKYFARMYEEIEKKEFADLQEAIDKMPGGADFRMFKERKDFSEIELTLMNDPIYITSRRLATMLHNKATLEFCNAMAADPAYTIYKNATDIPENNVSGFKLLDSRGGGKRYGDLTNKYVPLALYEELRGTAFANKFVSASYDALRMYDGLAVRQFFKKTKTLYNPTTRLGNITTNFAFAWLAGVDPFTMIKNRVKAKDSLDNYDSYAKELAIAGVLGTDVIAADLSQKKDAAGIVGFLEKVGLKKELANKARAVDKYMIESYGRTDDVAKISLYRSLVDDYGKSKEEAISIVGESMQNYATVGKAYQYFSKLPLIGNPFVKFSSDMARIVANGFANRPLYMASFLGMMYGTARLLSGLSGEPEDEREARESRAFIPKIPLGFTDIPLTWKVGKYEVNAARFISPYYVYDAGYRSNTIAELTKFAPIQLSYSNKVGFASDYMPVMSDPFIAPLAQVAFDKDFRGLPIADPNGSIYTRQTVTEGEALWNRFNYLGHSYASPAWGYVANLYSAAKGEGDLYGRRRDIPSAILNSVIKVQEMESKDVQKAVINQVKYIDSEYKQIKTDITSRRNDDIDNIRDIIGSEATESQKEQQIMNIKVEYSNFVEEMVGKMQELKVDRQVPMDRLYKLQNPKKND